MDAELDALLGDVLDGEMPEDPNRMRARPEEFIHIYVNKSAYLLRFLEHMIEVRGRSMSYFYCEMER